MLIRSSSDSFSGTLCLKLEGNKIHEPTCTSSLNASAFTSLYLIDLNPNACWSN